MKRFELILYKVLPYLGVFAAIFAIMFFGSQKDASNVKSPIAAAFNDSNYLVTADQISESYTVANIANAVSLPSTATISENYATVNAIYESTGTTSTSGTIIDRPSVIDTSNLSPRGVITHTVESGETIESIIAKYKLSDVTVDQVRWSNGLKTATISAGQKLLIPSVSGIVYTVKQGDNYDGIAEKYHSNTEEIIARNDLEGTEATAGMAILLPNGTLPETERPEYVLSAQNTSHQSQGPPQGLPLPPIPAPMFMFLIPVCARTASRSRTTTIGRICIILLRAGATQVPSVTVLGSPGTGAVLTCQATTGYLLACSATLVAGTVRLLPAASLSVRLRLTVQSFRLLLVVTVTLASSSASSRVSVSRFRK